MAFSNSFADLSTHLGQTEEFRQIILQGISFPASNYFDPGEIFRHLKLQETFVEAETLMDIRLSLETILLILNFLGKRDDEGRHEYPSLALLINGLHIEPGIPAKIAAIIDDKAMVRSNASADLGTIRQKKHKSEILAGKRIRQLLSEGKNQGWIPHDTELSLRNGRQVIPVSAAYKRKIRGFIHDQSATGQTVFLEPEEVFELNNQIRELEFEERQEIVRILKAFADYLRPMLPDLDRCYHMLGQVDAIRAKARLAIDMDALKPVLVEKPVINWVNARHPLLYLAFKQQNKLVEPFTAALDHETRILVISGPNAGGKSVCLKAFGLLQYMIQCGMLVPMADYSEAGIFDQLFIDIGDEQSLENDLSTYSSHLVNMKYFSANSNPRTLFLIDEFGTGTEPRMGGAIAEAVLESLARTNALGVVTTHYANLKVMAGKHEGMVNASMLFDTRNMKPLYRLKTGNPGSSFAFEIARTIGLPEGVLKKAEALAGEQNLDFDRQLQDLEVKKIELDQKEKELKAADTFLSDLIDKYQGLYDQVEGRKADILINARKEAKKILEGSNRMIENTIREIREHQAKQSQTRALREKLGSYIQEQDNQLQSLERSRSQPVTGTPVKMAGGPVKQGDMVRIAGQKSIGEVLEITGNQAIVSYGVIKLKAAVSKLEKLDKASIPEKKQYSKIKMTFDINEKAAHFNPAIDLRGFRAEEALTKLRSYMDDAILLNVKQVKILHGKGDGVLRSVIREFLQTIREVHRFRDEHPDRGGAGATIADFRL